MYKIFSIKRPSNKISAQRDLDAVLEFLKKKMKHELDIARLNPTIYINSPLLTEATELVEKVIKNIGDIKKKIRIKKEEAVKAKKLPDAKLSPDENYAIEMTSLRDIKTNGLIKTLSEDDKKLLKDAETQFDKAYSSALKSAKHKMNNNSAIIS